MTRRVARFVLLATALLLAGCSQSLRDYVHSAERTAHLKYCQEVYTLLGKPSLTQELTDGSQLWTYSFKIPRLDDERRTVIFACDVAGQVLTYTIKTSSPGARPPLRQRMSQ